MNSDNNFKANCRAVMAGALVLTCAVWAMPVHAGFEWTPPTRSTAVPAPSASVPSAPPVQDVAPVVQAPVSVPVPPPETVYYNPVANVPVSAPIEMVVVPAPSRAPVPPPALHVPPAVQAEVVSLPPRVQNADPMDRHPLPPPEFGIHPAAQGGVPVIRNRDIIVESAPLAPPVNQAVGTQFTNVAGFGRDIPLALALQQIAPAGHSFAFASNVNAGARVSWDGGRPWNVVLMDALRPHGLTADIIGTSVMVRHPHQAGFVSHDAAVNTPPHQSYPRRDPVAARERMMKDAGERVAEKEPAAFDPEALIGPVSAGDMTPGAEGAPMPLVIESSSRPQNRVYTQLTGVDSASVRPLDAKEIRYWQAKEGESLRGVLANWAEQAGVQLFWAEGPDYTLSSAVQMHGNFQTAIRNLLQVFEGTDMKPQAQLFPNLPAGPAVLIIDHSA